MKILITGGHGQLGTDCSHVLGQAHEVVTLDLKELDITDPDAVEGIMKQVSPDIVLNCAAFTKVDACETERELAWKVNVDGPKNLATWVNQYGGRIVHISTDYVFDGRKSPPEPYVETDETGPLSFYGRTKLEGELVIQQTDAHYAIVRTAWLYGIHGHNFLKTMLKLASTTPGREIKVVNDQFGSPTWSYRLAQQIKRIIEINGEGIFHATSEGYCTWYELAVYFLERMGVEHNIIPCSTEEYPTPATRPRNSILENKRLKNEGINIMPHWKDDVDQFVKALKEVQR